MNYIMNEEKKKNLMQLEESMQKITSFMNRERRTYAIEEQV